MMRAKHLLTALLFATLFVESAKAAPFGTAFTYQGWLNDSGNPAAGIYDLRFAVYNAATGSTSISPLLTNAATGVSNGLFAVVLDFGATFDGSERWLEIAVRTNGGGAFTTLAPRQALTPAPYAIMAGSASNVVGLVSANQLSGAIAAAQLPATVVTNNSSNLTLAGSFAGSGAGLTNLQTAVVKVISPTPPAHGDANWFGPWTPGTMSAGIQEALNSLPMPSSPKSPGGGKVIFMPGTFYTQTNIYWPTTNAFYLTIEGAGMLASGIVYAGATARNVLTVGSPNGLNGAHIRISDMFIASAVNANTNIIHLDGYCTKWSSGLVGGVGEADFLRLWIGYWVTMTNSTVFSPDSPGLFTSTRRNLIGLNIFNNFGSRISVRDCAFEDCIGLSFANDQGSIENNLFIACGIDGYNSVLNDWPINSPYRAGFACYFLDPYWLNPASLANNDSWHVNGNRFVIAGRTIFYQQQFLRPKAIYNNMIEGNGSYATTGAKLVLVNPEHVGGTGSYYHVTNFSDFRTWNVNPSPSNMVSEVGFNGGIKIVKGVIESPAIVSTNFQGNGSALTNIVSATALLASNVATETVSPASWAFPNTSGGISLLSPLAQSAPPIRWNFGCAVTQDTTDDVFIPLGADWSTQTVLHVTLQLQNTNDYFRIDSSATYATNASMAYNTSEGNYYLKFTSSPTNLVITNSLPSAPGRQGWVTLKFYPGTNGTRYIIGPARIVHR